MKSFLCSTLVQRFSGKSLEQLTRVHAHDWLLWEAGTWSPPRSSTVLIDRPTGQAGPTNGEGLVLALEGKERSSPQITLGRGAECDLSINDGTLSQLHLLFMRSARGWTVRDAGSKNGSKLDGIVLEPGKPVELKNGAKLQAGLVTLSYYEPAGLLARLREQ